MVLSAIDNWSARVDASIWPYYLHLQLLNFQFCIACHGNKPIAIAELCFRIALHLFAAALSGQVLLSLGAERTRICMPMHLAMKSIVCIFGQRICMQVDLYLIFIGFSLALVRPCAGPMHD